MTENQKPESRLDLGLADQRSLATMVDASLKRGSGLSIALSDATIGVSLDKLGDWTITVGLSSRSDRFHQSISCLERLGFFQGIEILDYGPWLEVAVRGQRLASLPVRAGLLCPLRKPP